MVVGFRQKGIYNSVICNVADLLIITIHWATQSPFDGMNPEKHQ